MRQFFQILSVFVFSLCSYSTYAATSMESRLIGVYSVGDCSYADIRGGEKLRIVLSEDSFHKIPVLAFVSYGQDRYSDFSLRLGSGSHPATGTDGMESWKTFESGDTFIAEQSFERKGSKTWPDLGYVQTYTFNFKGDVLNLNVQTKRLWGHAKDASSSCVLTSLKKDPSQIEAVLMPKVSAELEALEPKVGQGDFDQSTVQFQRVKLNVKDPSADQIQELVAVTMLPQYPGFEETKVTAFGDASQSREFAETAMATLTGFAKSFIEDAEDAAERARLEKEYQPLFDYVDGLEKFLKAKPQNYKVYLIEWSASDSDGAALMIIDTDTGEAVFLGAYYFS